MNQSILNRFKLTQQGSKLALVTITLLSISLFGCHAQDRDNKDFSRLVWHPVDSIFSLSVEREGSGRYQPGNLLGLELEGGVNVQTGHWVATAQLDSGYAALATVLAQRLLSGRLAGKVSRNAEGYVKARFWNLFRRDSVRVNAYLLESVSGDEAIALAEKLRSLPQVAGVHRNDNKHPILYPIVTHGSESYVASRLCGVWRCDDPVHRS
ncbi:MAG TPA: hypothetical protein VN616_07215 [Puia sp.]|nr:hypothetical protein [Puia sp.]